MSNKETRIYKIIANIIRVCILLIFIIKFVMKSYDHIYNLLGVFIFSFYEKLLKKLKLEFSFLVNCFFIIFLFLTQALGEACNFYSIFPWWDLFLHTSAGILFYLVGMEVIMKFNNRNIDFRLLLLFSFCFSVTIGGLWEVVEFIGDAIFCENAQQARGEVGRVALFDTMSDLITLSSGAFFMVLYHGVFKKRKKI